MYEIIRDILIASIVLFIGAMAAVAINFPNEFSMKKVLWWWVSATLLFIIFRLFF